MQDPASPASPASPGSPGSPGSPEGLDALVFQYLERVEGGASAAGVLDELCREHPGEAEALRRGVTLLRDVRLHPGPREDGLPERVAHFRLQRRLGAGGMGVVYLATQEHPTREVALKLVRPDQLWFEGYRERFTREIESAGRLAHPGIAPVYEMGEHDGVPWFSQEYVVGASLSELLAQLPARSPEGLRGEDLRRALADALEVDVPDSAWDEQFFRGSWIEVCLAITRQMAEALQHAHERGVLHRDIKPSNVLLTPGGRAVLVDFGLASLQGTDRLTKTGAQVGSLHYMPPEQLDGRMREIGPRSDVYSLGVTLYELLTLHAPYASQSVQRLRGMILEGDAADARRWNRGIPRDVNIVVQCAMDPSTERRYETALAFAADLAAAQTHRPIAARPAGPVLRGVRWVRRHPAATTALVAGCLLLVVGPLVFGVQSMRAARTQRALNEDLTAALADGDELLQSTLASFEDVVRWTATEALRDVPGGQGERLEVIDRGLAAFERIVEARPEDRGVRMQQALMLRTRGFILALLGRPTEAGQQFEEAANLFEALLESTPETDDLHLRLLRQLAGLRNEQAANYRELGQMTQATELGRAALELQRRVVDQEPEDAGAWAKLSAIGGALAGRLRAQEPEGVELEGLLEEAIAAGRRAVELDSSSSLAERVLYENLATRATWRKGLGRNRESLTDYREAHASIERAIALAPEDRILRQQHADATNLLLNMELRMGADPAQLAERFESLLEQCDTLIEEYPDVPEHHEKRILVLQSLGTAYGKAGDRAEAARIQEEVLALLLAHVRAHPEDRRASLNAGIATYELARTLRFDESLGHARLDRILQLCDEAEALRLPYARSNPGSPKALELDMLLHYVRGAAFNQLEMPDDLRAEADALRDLDFDVPNKHMLCGKLLIHWSNRTGEREGRVEALAQLERAVELGLEDVPLWEQGEFEQELADFPRVFELAELVRRRAGEL